MTGFTKKEMVEAFSRFESMTDDDQVLITDGDGQEFVVDKISQCVAGGPVNLFICESASTSRRCENRRKAKIPNW